MAMAVPICLQLCACDSKAAAVSPAAEPSDYESSSTGQAVQEEQSERRRRSGIEQLRRTAERWKGLAEEKASVFGSDPYALLAVADGRRAVGLLRGTEEVVLLDHRAQQLARRTTVARPSALAPAYPGAAWVVSQTSGQLQLVGYSAAALRTIGTVNIDGLSGARSLLRVGKDSLLVTEEQFGRVVRLSNSALLDAVAFAKRQAPTSLTELSRHQGLSFLSRHAGWCMVNALLESTVYGYQCSELAEAESPESSWQIEHDGPIWSVAASSVGGVLWLFLGGVEDKPLDRSIGSFGNIDSFVYAYQVSDGRVRKVAAANLSSLGVVTPKTIEVAAGASASFELTVTGYASPIYAELSFDPVRRTFSTTAIRESWWPGAAAVATLKGGVLFANPLLDGWMVRAERTTDFVAADANSGHLDARLGEVLAFTEIMSNSNSSRGALSRFTCETCHFEGYADGRTHHTGRGDVRATTKPLVGLANNAPHFSRALDDDLAVMVYNEFEAINAGNDNPPWFAVSVSEEPWLTKLDPRLSLADRLSPERMRLALMRFFVELKAEVPLGSRLGHWTPTQRRGAELFAQHCEGCHQAREDTRGALRLAFDSWEARTTGERRDLVWAVNEYRRTGITPYVHEKGARIPSLRRLYKKRPYFTNGSARTLQEVIEGFVPAPNGATEGAHAHPRQAGVGTHLSSEDVVSVVAFLHLL